MYKNAQYEKEPFTGKISGIRVVINGALSTVPIDPLNSDYQRIMALVEANEFVIAIADNSATLSVS